MGMVVFMGLFLLIVGVNGKWFVLLNVEIMIY